MWRFYDSSGRVKQNTKPAISLVTSLPSNPKDGDEILFTDSLTAGTYHWHLRYVAARASNKWVFVGGPGLYELIQQSESTTSTSYIALTTAGPTITVPLAGDYFVEIGVHISHSGDTSGRSNSMSYGVGAASAASDTDRIYIQGNAATTPVIAASRTTKKTGLAAGNVLVAGYKTSSTVVTGTWDERWMRVIPIALGG